MQIIYHLVSRTYTSSRWLHRCAEDAQRRDTTEIIQFHGDTPSLPSPVLSPVSQKTGVPQRSLSNGRMTVIPEFNTARNQNPPQYEYEYAALDSVDSSTLSEVDSLTRSVESGSSPQRLLRHTKSSRDMYGAAPVSGVAEAEVDGFADRFRALVGRVSRELEEARDLETETPPRTPPLHHVLDTHTPYMSIDEFGREVPTEEPLPILGGVIRRMPTIDSVGSREVAASLRSTTLVSTNGGCVGPPSIAPSTSTSSRPPTAGTMVSFNDAASVSVSAPSSPLAQQEQQPGRGRGPRARDGARRARRAPLAGTAEAVRYPGSAHFGRCERVGRTRGGEARSGALAVLG